MVGRLVYEVRLRPLERWTYRKSKRFKKWRWDVAYYKTTDPVNPGVEDGRWHLGGKFGYERYWLKAVWKIHKAMRDNPYKEQYEEV
jgi:hypothetical protein